MSTGANLGYSKPIDLSARDATTIFEVANLVDGAPAIAERADRVHVAGDKLLVIVEDAEPEHAIRAAQNTGAEADVWAVAHVSDSFHAASIAGAAQSGGRVNVGCVRYAADATDATDGVDGWIGTLRP